MPRPWPAMASALAMLLLPLPASAGTAADPEITDAAGDVQAFGAAVPVALDWGDIQAAWFGLDNGTVTLSIQVGGEAPQQGEVGVTFSVGRQHWIAGYTVVPGLYAGGFLSRSDAEGDVPDSETPEGKAGTWEQGIITVTFDRADIDENGTWSVIEEPWGWSESQATNGETYRLDRTEVGKVFLWTRAEAPTTPAPQAGPKGAPMPLAFFALATALTLARRRPSA